MSKNRENTMFGKKRSKLSVLPVIFSSILGAGALTGTALSVWHVSKNYQESSEFKKSYNARININPVAYDKEKHSESLALANLKESAKRLSAWLKYNGAESYDVSYELTAPDSITGSYENSGWLSAHYSVGKVDKRFPSKQNEEKIDNDPYLSYFNNSGFNTNNKTLVYRWTCWEPYASEASYTLLDFNDIFDMPTNMSSKDNNTKTLVDKDGKNGVLYKIKKPEVINEIYKDLKAALEDSKKEKEKKIENDFQKPRLYVINNIEQMFNEVNYHLLNYSAFIDDPTRLPIDYHNLYDGGEYAKFSETVRTKNIHKDPKTTLSFRLDKVATYPGKPGETTAVDLDNGEALNYLDLTKYGTIEASFLNKYVDKIFKFEDKDYEKFFPDKITDTYHNNDASTKAEPSLTYAWYGTNSATEADNFLSREVNYGFKGKVVNIDVHTGSTVFEALPAFKQSFASREVPPKFVDTIFGGKTIIGVLSLGFLLFLLALLIILAVLYRTTGVMSWICMMFMLSMTGLIALIGSSVISMSLLFGLFAMSLVGFLAAMAICGRVKRRICSNEDTSVAVIKGIKKALWPIVDISFITLLFGICFTYIAPMNLNPLGIVLIIGGFGTFICMYLLNALLMLLFFNNGLTMNKFIFLGRPNNKANDALAQSNSYVPSSLDATKLEFAFYDKLSTTRFGLINVKTLITLSVFGALMIAGIVVFSVKGLASSTLFHSSMCIVIESSSSPIDVLKSCGFEYSYYTNIGNMWYFYCDIPNADVWAQIVASFPDAQFGNIVGNTNKDILTFAMVSMLVAAASASVYTGIRSNWTTFVPMFAGSILVPLLIIGVGSMFKITFDQNVVLGFALAVVFNTIISNSMVASINEAWFRKESYTPDELKFIVTASVKNSLSYILVSALAYALFVVFFGVCRPNGLGSITWLMTIGCIVTTIVTPILVSYLLYYFLVIRGKVLTKRAERLANKVVVNMDEIDEQAIEGINKFTKPKAYAKKQTGETK